MQPSPTAETSRLLLPSLRFCILSSSKPHQSSCRSDISTVLTACARRSGIDVVRHDFDRGGASACADHRAEVRAAAVLGPVGIVDEIVDRPVDRLEGDLLRPAGGDDPSGLLAYRGLVPTRILPVIAAHV